MRAPWELGAIAESPSRHLGSVVGSAPHGPGIGFSTGYSSYFGAQTGLE